MGGEFGLPLPDDRLTLATLLLKKGYRTDAIVANTVYLQHAFTLIRAFNITIKPTRFCFSIDVITSIFALS